nr:hypothetical protein [[Pseudomonas] sp. BICA1-14]
MSRAYQYPILSKTDSPTFAEKATKTPVSVEVLFDILRRPRFAGTEGERYVIDTYIATLPGAIEDEFGNFWVTVNLPDGSTPTSVFSSHTDTVHRKKDADTYKLSIKKAWVDVAGGGVLGADCGTGIWLMLNMIKAQVPGLYLFHREEEIGGGGSAFIASGPLGKVFTTLGMKRCIAFDRKGVDHVITHQGGTRCCSDEFADALADALNAGSGMTFDLNDGGSFTDSANYTDLIGECTNLSVGYYDQHTQSECQDLSFCTHLAKQLIKIDWEALPTARAPGEEDPDAFKWNDWARTYRGSATTPVSDKYSDYYDVDNPLRPEYTQRSAAPGRHLQHDFDLMSGLIAAYPGEVTDILEQLGYDYDSLATELMTTYDCDLGFLWEGK